MLRFERAEDLQGAWVGGQRVGHRKRGVAAAAGQCTAALQAGRGGASARSLRGSQIPCCPTLCTAAALDVLGGGIRGLFRVDRSWRPKTAVAAVPAAAASGAGSSSRGWGGATQASSSGADQEGSWTAVAVAPAPRQEAASQASATEQQQQQPGGGVTRWAVMAPRRRAAAAPAAPAPAPVPTTRNLLAELALEHEDALSPDHSSDSDDA